ncbi:MAG: hypothetical protein KF690_09820, partial [Bacteroidetes bacterium]|nr:hypothetical protein [Bacteroidota bacterium]
IERDITIVAETRYDYIGRPAVAFLPSPAIAKGSAGISSVLKYHGGLHEDKVSEDLFDKEHFDLTAVEPEVSVSLCTPHQVGGLATTSGASRYYSADNPLQAGLHAHIPDAGEFPLMQVQYTPDNTGRIRRQSGVGPVHRLNAGHDIAYEYGKPDKSTLELLFGDQVGSPQHYFKETTTDPNENRTVVILDMHGRVIAQGLAGVAPDNLDPVYPDTIATPSAQAEDLLNNVFFPGYIETTSSVTTGSRPESYDFAYSLNAEELLEDWVARLGITPAVLPCTFCVPSLVDSVELALWDCNGDNLLCTQSGGSCDPKRPIVIRNIPEDSLADAGEVAAAGYSCLSSDTSQTLYRKFEGILLSP